MAKKLKFNMSSLPKLLKFWAPSNGKAIVHWLNDWEFEKLARRYGFDTSIGAFSVWGNWVGLNHIYLRNTQLDLLIHEIEHIEKQENFHG